METVNRDEMTDGRAWVEQENLSGKGAIADLASDDAAKSCDQPRLVWERESALALSRDLGLSYKSAFVLLHKLREAMAEELRGRTIGGEGKAAEVDGGYFGGYVRPPTSASIARTAATLKTKPASARPLSSCASVAAIQSPPCSRLEGQAIRFIQARIKPGTIVNADESAGMERAARPFRNEAHQPSRGVLLDGACTNWAETISAACAAPKSATITTSRRLSASLRARGVMARR